MSQDVMSLLFSTKRLLAFGQFQEIRDSRSTSFSKQYARHIIHLVRQKGDDEQSRDRQDFYLCLEYKTQVGNEVTESFTPQE